MARAKVPELEEKLKKAEETIICPHDFLMIWRLGVRRMPHRIALGTPHENACGRCAGRSERAWRVCSPPVQAVRWR